MICPLSPAFFFLLGAAQLSALFYFVAPSLTLLPFLLLVLLVFAVPLFPQCRLYLPVISRGRKDENAISLSFDDGPDPEVTPLVLDLLDRHSVKATFFVTGENAERHPEIISSILARGHSVGNHSYHHFPFLMLKGRAAIKREVESTQALLRRFGILPLAFRPPVGVTAPPLWRTMLELSMFCVTFSCRAGDFGNRRIRNLASRILKRLRPGDIVLLHDVAPLGEDIAYLISQFDRFISTVEERGLVIKPLARLIGREVMEVVTSSVGENPVRLFYDGFSSTYDEEQFNTGVSLSRLTEMRLFKSRIPALFQTKGRALEIGAGTGIFTLEIARNCKEVDALDISPRMLALLDEKCRAGGTTNIRTLVADAETVELEGSYDTVCAFLSLEYLKNLPAFLSRLAPHVRPGKLYFMLARRSLFRLVIQVGNAMRQGLWLKAHSPGQMKSMLARAGFVIISMNAHLLKFFIFGGMLLEVIACRPGDARGNES